MTYQGTKKLNRSSTLILGGPGAGKTTRLLTIVEDAIRDGVPPTRIAFCAFTKAAAGEAKARAMARFNLKENELPWFRTLHSTAFQMIGLRRNQVFSYDDGEALHVLTGEDTSEDGYLMTLITRGRVTARDLLTCWEELDILPWFRVDRFAQAYDLYKTDHEVVDYTDMLATYISTGTPLPVDVAVVDEAQDLSQLQWRAVEKMFSNALHVYYAGDDDQAIHLWSGADFHHFMHLNVDTVDVLPVSHRLPESVFNLAQDLISQVPVRYAKLIRSTGKTGTVEYVTRPDEVDLSTGSWLLLGRAKYHLNSLVRVARYQGVPYSVNGVSSINQGTVEIIRGYEAVRRGNEISSDLLTKVLHATGRSRSEGDISLASGPIWHDALVGIPLEEREFLLAYLRRGEKITTTPRVRISTIHSAKGMEADNVLLLTDLTAKVVKEREKDPDAETRVFYVGATRASENLFVVQQRSKYGFKL